MIALTLLAALILPFPAAPDVTCPYCQHPTYCVETGVEQQDDPPIIVYWDEDHAKHTHSYDYIRHIYRCAGCLRQFSVIEEPAPCWCGWTRLNGAGYVCPYAPAEAP